MKQNIQKGEREGTRKRGKGRKEGDERKKKNGMKIFYLRNITEIQIYVTLCTNQETTHGIHRVFAVMHPLLCETEI